VDVLAESFQLGLELGPLPALGATTRSSLAVTVSIASKMVSPYFYTDFLAYTGPKPLTMLLPSYFSMPSLVVGAVPASISALSWRPNSLSCTQRPCALTHSPALTDGREPATVTRSRWPLALTLSTAKPFSSLKKVTRSIKPDRLPANGDSVCNHRGFWTGCSGQASPLAFLQRDCSYKPTAVQRSYEA
jgi:hypothetical protein